MEYLMSPLLKSAAKDLFFKCVLVYLTYDVRISNFKSVGLFSR